MRKIFILLVSSLLILTSCKEEVKAQVDDKTEIVQEEEVTEGEYNRGAAKNNLKDYNVAMAINNRGNSKQR